MFLCFLYISWDTLRLFLSTTGTYVFLFFMYINRDTFGQFLRTTGTRVFFNFSSMLLLTISGTHYTLRVCKSTIKPNNKDSTILLQKHTFHDMYVQNNGVKKNVPVITGTLFCPGCSSEKSGESPV